VENIWIGFDDTDSKNGGCTTYVACSILKKINAVGLDIISYPRLVRLNPNIPWKTRGNGAISLRIGHGIGEKTKIGEIEGKDIFCYKEMKNDNVDIDKIREIVVKSIDEQARLEDENTNSGFVLIDNQPSFETYDKTVKEVIKLEDIENLLKESKAEYKGYKNRRGLIGATASIAWLDSKDKTYELIAYRQKNKWGKTRFFDDKSTIKMDKKFISTFDNYDYKNKHNRLFPSSPCPVLFGIRGENQKELIKAKSLIKSEDINSWLIFVTNQGTDDHLQKKKIRNIKPYESVIVEGEISKTPHTIDGGHVIFSIKDSSGEVDCAAYEPTKEFRDIIRKLDVGDNLEVFGGIRENPITINLEKINILNLANIFDKVENPVCPNCGKHMKSKGSGQGFKCVKCKTKSNKPIIKQRKREIKLGFYEVPVCSRRHLSKPLKRMK